MLNTYLKLCINIYIYLKKSRHRTVGGAVPMCLCRSNGGRGSWVSVGRTVAVVHAWVSLSVGQTVAMARGGGRQSLAAVAGGGGWCGEWVGWLSG